MRKEWITGIFGILVWGALKADVALAAVDPPKMNVLKDGTTIQDFLKLIVNILLYGLGAAATLGVVIAGILYLTARENPQQISRAKTRLIEIAIGLVVWAMLYTLLKFLWPGFTW